MTTTRFDSVKALYEDMTTYNQSFTKSENEYFGNTPIIEGGTPYRLVELKNGKLQFYSNKFGGAELCINGDIQYSEKIDNPDCGLSEYRLEIKGLDRRFILLACKKREYQC